MNPEHIRVLLDADAMRHLLGAIPLLADGTAGLSALSLDRLWVKPGRHFHASYRVTLSGRGLRARCHDSPSGLSESPFTAWSNVFHGL